MTREVRGGKDAIGEIGLPLNRDSERMVMSDIIYSADEPKGWVLNKSPTNKEKRYCEKMGLEILDIGVEELLAAAGWAGGVGEKAVA
jgi:predicted metal-dependent TIM-barrel fold hydrolase